MAKISYETHFKSTRPDGRHVSSLAAYMEKLRHMQPKLSLPKTLTVEEYEVWREKVKIKYRELLHMPEFTKQPKPIKLSSVKRDTYTVEKWELYPDDYEAVPFLVLIPDGASTQNKVPGVICIPGSTQSKEMLSGEPMLDPPNCQFVKFPERNQMARYMVKNGMVAFAFDNVAIAERGLPVTDHERDIYNSYSRSQLCHGYLHGGFSYPGMSTFHILCLLQNMDVFEYVDRDRLAVSGHSLGTEPAMALGVLCDDIKAVIFNDFLHNDRIRFAATTESEEGNMNLKIGNWHIIPGYMQYFDFPDLCAAIAPKHLAFNEGGGIQYFKTVKRAYELLGVGDNLQITHYPIFSSGEKTIYEGDIPLYGLTHDEHFELTNCYPPDHSFREEPSIRLLKKCFGIY